MLYRFIDIENVYIYVQRGRFEPGVGVKLSELDKKACGKCFNTGTYYFFLESCLLFSCWLLSRICAFLRLSWNAYNGRSICILDILYWMKRNLMGNIETFVLERVIVTVESVFEILFIISLCFFVSWLLEELSTVLPTIVTFS